MLPRRATLLPHAFLRRGLPLVSRCLLPVVVGLSILVPSLAVAQSSVRLALSPASAGEGVGRQTVTVTARRRSPLVQSASSRFPSVRVGRRLRASTTPLAPPS